MTVSETKKLNKKLNRFLILGVTVFSIAVYLAFDNAGFKREIRTEIRGFRELFEMHIEFEIMEHESMKKKIEINRLNYRDISDQSIEKWGYKPTIRTGSE